MSGYLKRIFPIFLAVTLFATVIMLCCVRKGENKIQMTAGISNSNSNSNSNENSGEVLYDPNANPQTKSKNHVFHKGEMRGIWIPYFNLSDGNIPMSEEQFKKHFDEIIRTSKEHGINTLFVHVRSHCDAAYPSEIFPFANVFTGNSDITPDYDPLEYMIKAAHKAGLEFHAWLNPFRVISDAEKIALSANSPCYRWLHDDNLSNDRNLIECNGGLYLNPSKPEARSLIIRGVRELVNNYDIDGIHLDDYFYMFTESEYDSEDYNEYLSTLDDSSNALPLIQWRCTNINILISGIYAVVKNADDNTLFGISPQGNMENDINMGADVYSWCSLYGYVDYIAPQIYTNSDNPLLPYEDTVEEWKNIITNDRIKLYIGLALYKAGSEDDNGTWLNSDDIISRQIEYARSSNTDGFILYSWEYLNNEQTSAEVTNIENIINNI